jgi:hypothetical protein
MWAHAYVPVTWVTIQRHIGTTLVTAFARASKTAADDAA